MAVEVQYSRDGDRYHYYWAATRALRLLDLTGDLGAVWVEGVPKAERLEGEEVVDVAEYFGGDDLDTAQRCRYTQIKHSTKREDLEITASELKKTLEKFAKLDREALAADRAERLTFGFVANRSLSDKVRRSLHELGEGSETFTHSAEVDLLRGYMAYGTDVAAERSFCRRLEVRDGQPGVVELERDLLRQMNQFLPGGGTGTEFAQLVEEVSRCATSLRPTQRLVRSDVLLALRVTEDELFPAPNKIEPVEQTVRTSDLETVASELTDGDHTKLLVTAVGGIGKSVLATQLAAVLPRGSEVIVYDCFAGGDYRKASERRHHHRVGLTQLSNDLASRGLCTPLVPAVADDRAYTLVFMKRIVAASAELARASADALLAIVVDAADNAAIAAEELQDQQFVTSLLREDWPANARLVVLCRPERSSLLDVPKRGVVEIQLTGFRPAETLAHLRSRFPHSTDDEGAELHALSSGNPRVQAMAMSTASSVGEALDQLQLAAHRPDDALDAMLEKQVRQLSDEGHLPPEDLRRLCQAIAALHPSIPLADLASITEIPVDAIRSFAMSLGRGLHVAETTLQFRDEPTESWFRRRYALSTDGKRDLARSAQAHASGSGYLAATLPQLLLEAGLLDELVTLALSDGGLPGDIHELEAQEIARARGRFALSATLRADRYSDAARLAVRTGALSSGRSRRLTMVRAHPDLAARFIGRETVAEMCARRELAADWPGSNLHTEAVLLSSLEEFRDLGRSRTRSAFDNVLAILRAPDEERDSLHDKITTEVVADLALTAANLHGASGLVEFLSRWRPDAFVGEVVRAVCSRLVADGRSELVDYVIVESESEHARIAAVDVMFEHGLHPSQQAVGSLATLLRKRKAPFESRTRADLRDDNYLGGVVWASVHGLRCGLLTEVDALQVLRAHAPSSLPDYIGSRWSSAGVLPMSLAIGLRLRLSKSQISLKRLASPDLQEQLEDGSDYTLSQQARAFRDNIGPMVPWLQQLLEAMLLGPIDEVKAGVTELVRDQLKPVSSYNTPYVLHNTVSEIATRLVAMLGDENLVGLFGAWYQSGTPYIDASRVAVLRISAHEACMHAFALGVLADTAQWTLRDRTDAEYRVDALLELARTILPASESESKALFDLALREADLVGDDLYVRCEALLGIARPLGTGSESARAYRLFQIAEALDHSDSLNLREVGRRMFAMHGPTYLSCISRSRDRRTLDFRIMLAAPLEAVRDQQLVGRFALCAFEPTSGWADAADELRGETGDLVRKVLGEFTRFHSSPLPAMTPTSSRWEGAAAPAAAPVPLEERVASLDFSTDEGWTTACRETTWKDDRTELVRIALSQQPANRPAVLRAFSQSPLADRWQFVALAKEAARLDPTPALNAALRDLANDYVRRFAQYISTSSYDDESLRDLAVACHTTDLDLRRAAFVELSGGAHDLAYGDCFRLAERLGDFLTPEEAAGAFDDLAALFDDLSPPDSASDGSLQTTTAAPEDEFSAIAGLIWGALGDMSSAVRWQAAHAVTLLAKLGCTPELESLQRFADGSASEEAFVDRRFPFYRMHAQMWLLLGLLRAANDPNPSPIVGFEPWLRRMIDLGGHAANQLIAQRTLSRLATSPYVTLLPGAPELVSLRRDANWTEMDWSEARERPNPVPSSVDESEEHTRWFFMDFEDWCGDLANVFGTTEADVERLARRAASRLDGYTDFVAGTDARTDAGVFGEGRSFSNHRSWPEEEPLGFYLAIHGLLAVGAQLADAYPAFKEPDAPDDAYSEWLAQFLPKRRDGRWLADRRDPPPSPNPQSLLAAAGADEEWPWNMSRSDFEEVAGAASQWVTISASVDTDHERLSEDIAVESALVRPATAQSLLAALQTSPTGWFWLPDAGSNGCPDEPPFDLEPWLDTSTLSQGIDELDGRASGIAFPPRRPSREIAIQFVLTPDEDLREWSVDGRVVMQSTVWSNRYSRSHDSEEGTSGSLLRIRADFLSEVLRSRDRHLILKVSLRRQRVRPYYERRKAHEDDFEWLDWSSKIYLVDSNGGWFEY